MTPRQWRKSAGPALPQGGDGFVGEPVLDVAGQGAGRTIATVGIGRHGLQADGIECQGYGPAYLVRAREGSANHAGDHRLFTLGLEWGPAGQDVVQGGA